MGNNQNRHAFYEKYVINKSVHRFQSYVILRDNNFNFEYEALNKILLTYMIVFFLDKLFDQLNNLAVLPTPWNVEARVDAWAP